MAKGIAITITRMQEVREPRSDDARFHKVWNGRQWVSLGTLVWSPRLANMCGVVTEPVTRRGLNSFRLAWSRWTRCVIGGSFRRCGNRA